ncbi:phospholipid scramblase-related protein [Parasphingorhabdus pacifica]
MNASPPPGWYPDQADQRYVRWWDGMQWSQHVQPAAQQRPPPPQPGHPQQAGHSQQQAGHSQQQAGPAQQQPGHPQPGQQHPAQQYPAQQHPAQAGPAQAEPAGSGGVSDIELAMGGTGDAAQIQQQVQQRAGVGGPVAGGGGTLFTEPVLVINQQAKLIEMSNEYAVYDQSGNQLGSVLQTNQSGAQKALRLFSKMDSMMTVQLEIRDIAGNPLLKLTRPATMWKSTVHVQRPDGSPIGDIRMEKIWGKVRFAYEVGGQRIGGMNALNLRARELSLVDHQETELGRITKTWQGLAKAFTTADNYVLQLHRPLPDPLASMVVASALTVDTVLQQQQ